MDTRETEAESRERASTAPAVPGFFAAALNVLRIRGLTPLQGRRGALLGLLCLLPILLMLAGRLMGVERSGGSLFFIEAIAPFYHYIDLIVFLFLGCSILGEPIEDRTIVYDLVCPVSRSALYAGALGSYTISSLALLLPALGIAYLLCMVPFGAEGLTRNLPVLTAVALAAVLAALAYGTFFIFLSLVTRRAVLVAIVLCLGLDGFLAHLPLSMSSLSPWVHLRNLMALLSKEERFLEMWSGFRLDVRPGVSLLVLVSITLVFTAAGVGRFKARDFI